jgi:multiple sugar transport system permease protein
VFAARRFELASKDLFRRERCFFTSGSDLLALLLTSRSNKRSYVCRGRLMPWAVSPVVVAMVWRLLAHPQISPVGIALNDIDPDWIWQPLASTRTALAAVIAINVWHFTPFYMLMLLAGLQAIDPTIYEVAMIDGASLLQRIWFVTLPQVRRLTNQIL